MTPAKCLPTERIGQMRPVYVDDVFTTTRLTSNLQGSFGEIACELCTSSILCSNVNWGLCHMTTQTAFFLTFSKPVQSVSPLRVHDKSKLIPTLIRSTSVWMFLRGELLLSQNNWHSKREYTTGICPLFSPASLWRALFKLGNRTCPLPCLFNTYQHSLLRESWVGNAEEWTWA